MGKEITVEDIKEITVEDIKTIKTKTKMSKEEIKQLAEEISFRLLATRKHPEHEWLIKRLDEIINNKSKQR